MNILINIFNTKLVRFLVVTIPLFVIIYFAYFYNENHHKEINRLRIIDFYDLRVDMSVSKLEDKYGKPYRIDSDYNDIKKTLRETALNSEYLGIDEKTCENIFKGKARKDAFYSNDYNLDNVEEYVYRYYDSVNNPSSKIIYVKFNKVVGVSCE